MQICSISKNTFSNQINVQEKFTHESSGNTSTIQTRFGRDT